MYDDIDEEVSRSSEVFYSLSKNETEEERVKRVQKLLRNVMRMKLKIPCCKCYYVDGWGWL